MWPHFINKFDSIKEWKDYCFNTHSLYLKNVHFKKWINKKDIHIFNFSNLKKEEIKYIKLGVEDAIKVAKLHFKIYYDNPNSTKKIINIYDKKINSSELLKMIVQKRKKRHKEHACIFIFDKPIKSQKTIIKDGEALTFVSEGMTFFTFDTAKSYPHNFLRRRSKHEASHLLGLNFHHEDTKVQGYKHDVKCNMEYNAPTMKLCQKCKDALKSFWKGIEYATKKQFVKN